VSLVSDLLIDRLIPPMIPDKLLYPFKGLVHLPRETVRKLKSRRHVLRTVDIFMNKFVSKPSNNNPFIDTGYKPKPFGTIAIVDYDTRYLA